MLCASVREGNPRAKAHGLPSRTDAQTYTNYSLNQHTFTLCAFRDIA